MLFSDIIPQLWPSLIWPLIRLIFFISIGLLIANFIESLNWTGKIAILARPMIRFGNLSDTAGASFSMALFSGVSANTMLSEAYEKKQIQKNELILSNLFNSLPTYFLHLPTVFFITVPLIKGAAIIYVGLTFGAAIFRTVSIVILGHFLLSRIDRNNASVIDLDNPRLKKADWQAAFRKSWKRFKKRIQKIIRFTVPIYIVIFLMQRAGIFTIMEKGMAEYLSFLPWLTPQSMGIITLHVAAEFTAGLAVAGALIQEGSMNYREVVLALLVGNVLSSPVRAIRHQFPYYAGIFQPKLAGELIVYNQIFRVGSLILMGCIYYVLTL
ncbi:MAG TPA: hypothetical protein EYP35_05325 [Desulfobacterales bacterium]|nr:hypothetical protein [Desulfobacterales bacterium]HIP38072.1 hypothetical protein [Desulfocapsa sulfexigens]